MSFRPILYILLVFITNSCRNHIEQEHTNYQYHDILKSDTNAPYLYAVTNEEYLQYGSDVAYLSVKGDTIIPFGNFAYFGTDSLKYYANVLLRSNDSTYGKPVGVNRNGHILFDLVSFDNGPDYFSEGLTRVQRNRKMGYANEKGEIVIPCQFAFAKWFENGKAQVTFEVRKFYNKDEHMSVKSNSWFEIDKQGNRIKTP